MTRLRKVMLEELQRRNFAKTTIQYYVKAVEDFAVHFGKPPDQLNADHLRQYQVYLLNERKLQPRTARLHALGCPLWMSLTRSSDTITL